MQEHEMWLTALLNSTFAGPANSVMQAVGYKNIDPAHPWSNWLATEILVVAILVVLVAILRRGFSVDKPGGLQHTAELIFSFVKGETDDAIEHHGSRYVAFFGTLFVFILFMNLIGIIPGMEAPTMNPSVPAGLALAAFAYYNWAGIREQGILKYMAHFMGPVWWLAPIMIPIEIISHLARLLSLTIRLYANMFAGEQVTNTFLALTYFVIPSVFMGLHVFVSLLQAFIFMLLTIIYVSQAVAHDHSHEPEV
jgi:F-type H+-transporting ATPase subunit a